MELTKDLKLSVHPLIPEGWLGFDTETYFYLFTRGAEVTINKKLIDVNDYLKKLNENRKNNGK